MMHQNSFNRRHSPNRRRTKLAARLHLDERVIETTILDVSYEGMKILTEDELPQGTAVTVEIDEERVPAIVHWWKDGRAGLHLLERLERETLLTLETADDDLAEFR